ncbi:MAG: ankyrin repeat domain-containing protein [Wolbachia endosymbiont of Xenopsylla cheopis]
MLGSEQQLDDNNTSLGFPKTILDLDNGSIINQGFKDLEMILNENDVVQASNDLSTTPGDDNAINQTLDNSETVPNIAIPDFDDLKAILDFEVILNENDIIQASNDLSTTSGDGNAINQTLDNSETVPNIAIPDFDDLKAILDFEVILNENDIIQASNDLSTTSGDGNAISSTTEALDNAKGINEIANQSSIPFVNDQTTQPQDKESQNSTIDKAEPGSSGISQQALATVYNDCVQELQVTYSNCINKLQTVYNNINKFQTDASLPNSNDSQLPNIKSGNSKETKGLLHPVTKGKDLKIIKKLLQGKTDINEKNNMDDSRSFDVKSRSSEETQGLLHSAIKSKNIKIVKKLLHSGANINEQDNSGNTPLHIAIRYNNIDILNTLLEFNPDTELRNNQSSTPLHCAIGCICLRATKLLLNYGADTNAQDSRGNTVLHKIISSKSSKVILSLEPILENKNTDLNIKNSKGESFINIVLSRFKGLNYIDRKEFIKHLKPVWKHYSRLSNESRSIIKESEELYAIVKRYRNEAPQTYGSLVNSVKLCSTKEEIIKILQLRKVKINDKNLNGNTLLHKAVNEPFSMKVIGILLDIVSDVNTQNDRGNTALHIVASSDKRLAITKVLLSYGASVNLQNVSKQTPLHIAAARSSTRTLEALLSFSDIDPNKQDMLGNTALHNALRSKMPFLTVELLLKNDKVNLNIKNKEGQCFTSIVLDGLKIQGNKNLVKLLAKHYSRLDDESKLIIKSNRKFYTAVKEHRKKLIPYNILNQPSSSSFANEFFNIAK